MANEINYFVDPVTYVLNEPTAKLHNENGELRRSYKKYINALNLGSINFINENITLNYFKKDGDFDDNKITRFVESFINFQAELKELDEETKEFLEFFKKRG